MRVYCCTACLAHVLAEGRIFVKAALTNNGVPTGLVGDLGWSRLTEMADTQPLLHGGNPILRTQYCGDTMQISLSDLGANIPGVHRNSTLNGTAEGDDRGATLTSDRVRSLLDDRAHGVWRNDGHRRGPECL